MTTRRHRQAGVTLIITLIMLVMFTLFAVSAIRLANVNLRLVGNYQWQKEMEALTDSAIEQLLSNTTAFDPSVTNSWDICPNGNVVATGTCGATRIGTIGTPPCLTTKPAKGYSKTGPMVPEDNDWRITANAADSWTGAQVSVTRGVTIRQLAGNCTE